MTEDDLHDEIDQLAAQVEQTIAKTQVYLADLPEFESRSERSRAVQRKILKRP